VTSLFLAAVFLPVSHFGISSTRLRDLLVARLGERGYLAAYSLLTAAAFAWLVSAWRGAPFVVLWHAPPALRGVVFAVVLAAFLLLVPGLSTPNPTTVGQAGLLERPDVVRGILRITRNPFLWAVALWAGAHVLATGDLAGLLLFGSVGTLGLAGAPLLDAKKARRLGERWRPFAAATSSVPFAAIVAGRQRLDFSEIGLARVTLALALFALALWGHRWAFGVSPLPGW
jgi:uncharacterized membrane protein